MIPAMKAVLSHNFETIVESGAYNIFAAEEEVIEGDTGWEHYVALRLLALIVPSGLMNR